MTKHEHDNQEASLGQRAANAIAQDSRRDASELVTRWVAERFAQSR